MKIDDLNRSYNLVKNNSHPNFYLLDLLEDKHNIEIEQTRKMINFCNKSSFNNNEKKPKSGITLGSIDIATNPVKPINRTIGIIKIAAATKLFVNTSLFFAA